MSCDGVAIRVRDVSKHYFLYGRPQDRLKQSIVPRLQRLAGRQPAKYYRDFAALNGVSFEIKRGETVGIIGRNGSGKSTLLQIICGTLQPSSGSVEVNGRIAALLELGAGFNTEYTGRENVYLNAAILGLANSEIDARFDAIAAFADIGAFIDQPVKTYSSGMYVRLAFATAINVDPDILVVDEALAVGDEAFQRKCFARIEEIQARGGTILFVSHAAQTIVQLCSRALLIEAGELLLEGRPKTVTGQYQRLVNASAEAAAEIRGWLREMAGTAFQDAASDAPSRASDTSEERPGNAEDRDQSTESYNPSLVPQSTVEFESRGARIRDVEILTLRGSRVNVLQLGRRYIFQYFAEFDRMVESVGFGMYVRTLQGVGLGGVQTAFSRSTRTRLIPADTTARIRIEFTCVFLPGTYLCNCGILGSVDDEQIVLHRLVDIAMFKVASDGELAATGVTDIGPAVDIELSPSSS